MPPTKPVTIILADDHSLFRLSLKIIISEIREFKLAGEAKNGLELVDLAKKIKPDIIITDIVMPVMDGIEATRQIMKMLPETKIIALTIVENECQIAEMLEAGVKGYLLKDVVSDELTTAIKTVHEGETYFSDIIKTSVTKMIANGNYNSYKKKPKLEFSEKEIAIIKLISNENSNKEISEKLGLRKRAVEGIREQILHKLGAKNSAGIVAYAIKNNLWDG